MISEICQNVLDLFVMPAEWALRIVVPIFKGNCDIKNCSCYRAVKLHEHGMKVVERVLENRLCRIVSVDEMQFGFMPERGTIDAVFMLRTLQKEYHAKGKKLYMCFVDLEKAFDRLPRKVLQWPLKKKKYKKFWFDLSVRGSKDKVRVDSELSEEFETKVGMHQGSVLSPFIFAVVVDVVTEFARDGVLSELLYADDLVLTSETI